MNGKQNKTTTAKQTAASWEYRGFVVEPYLRGWLLMGQKVCTSKQAAREAIDACIASREAVEEWYATPCTARY